MFEMDVVKDALQRRIDAGEFVQLELLEGWVGEGTLGLGGGRQVGLEKEDSRVVRWDANAVTEGRTETTKLKMESMEGLLVLVRGLRHTSL